MECSHPEIMRSEEIEQNGQFAVSSTWKEYEKHHQRSNTVGYENWMPVPLLSLLGSRPMKKIVFNAFSGCLLVAAILTGLILIAMMFLRGGVWLGDKALPYFDWASRITLGVVGVILLPMATFHQTQRQAAKGLLFASSIFGITLWVWGLVLTYNLWGGGMVLLGIFLFGVGVVPMGMLATLFASMLPTLGQLILLAVLTYGTRRFSKVLLLKLQREEQKVYELEIL